MENVSRIDTPKIAGYAIVATSIGGIAYELIPLFVNNPVAIAVLAIAGLLTGLHLVRS